MSHFYGVLSGQAKTEATRRGSKIGGITCTIASWKQAIKISLVHDDDLDLDRYYIDFIPWQGQGKSEKIACGALP